MKSPHLFGLILLIFIACSNNEEEIGTNEPIVGTWQLYQIKKDGITIEEQCMRENNFIANEDGSIIIETYRATNPNSNCILVINTATWKASQNNNYEISFDNSDESATLHENTFTIRSLSTETTREGKTNTIVTETVYLKKHRQIKILAT
ncbi:hypothetical protein [Tenacibaculum sp. SG-28]|uniref:hypothetical protein n=1 Tax=Tenacibaculum sp. SG-28 TaxID=754426 RepID=UPI000CF44DD4|nr:hypothetical protein [Tenacibaculum sp. SG-28]PQJ19953.1 hypothetical protein BSU00_11620 [Tenacibaculum sp. SG-28]